MAQSAGLLKDSLTGLSLQQFVAMHCGQLLLTSGVDVTSIVKEVEKLGVMRHVPAGQRLFSFGDMPDSFFLILKVGFGHSNRMQCRRHMLPLRWMSEVFHVVQGINDAPASKFTLKTLESVHRTCMASRIMLRK